MRFRPLAALCLLSLFALTALTPASASAATGIVSCSTFTAALRDTTQTSPFRTVMKSYSSTFTNPANGQTFRFLAVRPANPNAPAYETLVFFNGTSQITPDWPVGLLAGSPIGSLCDNNALVFSDYPGIGDTTQPADAAFTFDNIASNVFNLMGSLNDSQGFKIKSINPTGWSLGTEAALKFSALATWNNSFKARGMKINKLFLIAAKIGGDLESGTAATALSCSSSVPTTPPPGPYFTATGNQAMCVTSIMDRLFQLSGAVQWTFATSLKNSLVASLFPYSDSSGAAQSPYGPNDPGTICAATVSTNEVTSLCNLQEGDSVTACGATATACAATQSLFEANRLETPYFNNISYAQFAGQRRLNFMYGYGNCPEASTASWSSANCAFNPNQVTNTLYNSALVVNGSPCVTIETTSDTSSPIVLDCPQFAARLGGVYIFNGAEDMFIRHDYANALCNWFNSSGRAPCTVNTFPNAGHGVQYLYASQIYSAINGALPRPR